MSALNQFTQRYPFVSYGVLTTLLISVTYQMNEYAIPRIDAEPKPSNPIGYICVSVFSNMLASHMDYMLIQNGCRQFAALARGLFIGSIAVAANLALTYYAANFLSIAATQTALGVLTSSAFVRRDATSEPGSAVGAANLLQVGASSLINLAVFSLDKTLVFTAAAAFAGGYAGSAVTNWAPKLAEAIRFTVYGTKTIDELEPVAAR